MVNLLWLRFGWPAEVTTQVWANCGDVTVKAGSGLAPAPAPEPAALYGCTDSTCVADPAGVPKETCLAVCR